MHIAYVMTENDDKQMRSYDSFFPALKNLHISTPNSFSRGSGSHDNLLGTEIKFNLSSLLNIWLAGDFVQHTYNNFNVSRKIEFLFSFGIPLFQIAFDVTWKLNFLSKFFFTYILQLFSCSGKEISSWQKLLTLKKFGFSCKMVFLEALFPFKAILALPKPPSAQTQKFKFHLNCLEHSVRTIS